MKIGERVYTSFELKLDRSEPSTDDVPFVADLQNARVGAATVDVSAVPAIVSAVAALALPTASPEVLIGAPLGAPGAPVGDAAPARTARPPSPTPLELAVQELLAQLPADTTDVEPPASDPDDDHEPATGEPLLPDALPLHVAHEPAPAPAHAPTAKPTATLAVREPAPLPDNPNPSHVHLVVEDGAERVVVTVAVRGAEVNVGLRASDGEVTAALARNAATLDHAMRARGLDLTSFTAERDRSHDHEEREREPSHEQETA